MTDTEFYEPLPFYESSTKCGHLLELGYENFTVFENPDYDSAIIGITQDNRVVYDYERMIEHLMETDRMSYMDAMEFIDYNTLRALPYFGEGAPLVMYGI